MKTYLYYIIFIMYSCTHISDSQNEYWEDGSPKIIVSKERFGNDSLIIKKYYKKTELDLSQYYKLERYYFNGQLEEVGYLNHKREKVGEWKSWYKNGQVGMIEKYVDGKRNGIYESWLPDGSPNEKFIYKNGVVLLIAPTQK